MNRKSKIIIMLAIAGVFSLMAQLTYQNQTFADETRIIRIYADLVGGISTRIEPKDIWVRPGTTIVWNNWANDAIQIVFKEGAKCDAGTQSAMGFNYNAKTTCVVTTQYIPFGGTASLMFKDPGRYDYEIELVQRKVKDKGSITVRPVDAQ